MFSDSPNIALIFEPLVQTSIWGSVSSASTMEALYHFVKCYVSSSTVKCLILNYIPGHLLSAISYTKPGLNYK